MLHGAEEHLLECRRCAKRLLHDKALPTPFPPVPDGADPRDPNTWRIEDIVCDRVCRQLRAVGDALAWRLSGYDRRYVIALSSNDPAGLMARKAGLPHELGAMVELRNRGSLGLLHGLTNCLRIGDITEFKSDGSALLYEIKSRPGAKAGPQHKRMKAAVAAALAGGELPGRPGTRIVAPKTLCSTHMRSFTSVISNAHSHGIAVKGIADSRVLTAVSFPALASARTEDSGEQVAVDINAQRQQALQETGIDSRLHHIRLASVTRNRSFLPSVAPFALYPLPPLQAALLICDFICFDITACPECLARPFERRGIHVDITLPPTSDNLVAATTIITLSKGPRILHLHPGALYELLMECLDVVSWASAVTEVFDDPDAPLHPVLAFSTKRVWR